MKKKEQKSFLEIFPFAQSGEMLSSLVDISQEAQEMKKKAAAMLDSVNSILAKLNRPEVILFTNIFELTTERFEVINALQNSRIVYYGDLVMRTKDDLASIGLVENEIFSIEQALRKIDLRLGMTKEDIKSWIAHKNRAREARKPRETSARIDAELESLKSTPQSFTDKP